MIRDALASVLARQPFAILDGGLATQLEARGCELDDPLWSAKVLLDAPAQIVEVHRAYVAAGADIVTTASYQATLPGLRARGLSEAQARALLRETVEQARRAAGGSEALIAASIGSYGAYLADGSEYRGDYGVEVGALVEFHRERLVELCACGPDLLAFETIPSASEAAAIAELLEDVPGARAWVSFSLRGELGSAPRISDGALLREAISPLLEHPRIAALGVNCVAPDAVLPAIDALAEAAPGVAIVVYPNAGERWRERGWVGEATELERFVALAEAWLRAGARIIGGCCRTGPEHTRALARLRDHLSGASSIP